MSQVVIQFVNLDLFSDGVIKGDFLDHTKYSQGHIYSFGEEGMQLVQPSKFFSLTIIFRTHSIGSIAISSNAEKFRCLYSYYGSCMPSSPKHG